jgi:YidC/Oxa1 family membrane protein insertase
MKHLRTFLWVGLALILIVNYSTWNHDYAPLDAAIAEADAKAAEQEKQSNPLGAAIPQVTVPAASAAATATPAAALTAAPVPTVEPAPAAEATPAAAGTVLNVRTDVLDVDVNLVGGELQRADLLKYPLVKGEPAPVRLLRKNGAGDQYLLQTGLAGVGGSAEDFPTHVAQYRSESTGFVLDSELNEMRVPLMWTSPNGVTVTKTLIFRRGAYRIDVEYAIANASGAAWSAAPYAQILHDLPAKKTSYFDVTSYSFTGPALWDGGKYQKLKISDKDDASLSRTVTDGWIAALQHHFVTAIAPARTEAHRYTLQVPSQARGNEYVATSLGPTVTIAPGGTANITQTLFVGPKLQAQLEPIHPELGRAADFGMLTFLSRPLFWLMTHVHDLFNNWGLTIIFVTFLLKLALYPLSETSGRSMAKMKLVAPRLKLLQETYKDDRQKLGAAMMELYKKEKVNPAAGCLPMLIQIPVFLAFYWVLLESVEMRQAPFMGWIHDISARDPYFILPAIMAGAMFLQYKVNPQPADPMQAKVMMILPLVMSVTFAFFPSGLVLYWVTNTILTIAQQWNINRRIEAGNTARN